MGIRLPALLTLALLLSGGVVLAKEQVANWSMRIDDAKDRFELIKEFDDKAVLDYETGLVWERYVMQVQGPWHAAVFDCAARKIAGRYGWRLPSVEELASLLQDVDSPVIPSLPPGHPFIDVLPSRYWTSTERSLPAAEAWTVAFDGARVVPADKTGVAWHSFTWCVRGAPPGL